MKYKDFMKLCKDFIDAKRELEKEDNYTQKDDLAVLYRFICLDGWERLAKWRDKK